MGSYVSICRFLGYVPVTNNGVSSGLFFVSVLFRRRAFEPPYVMAMVLFCTTFWHRVTSVT